MRRCPKCNRKYDETWKICQHCNIQLIEESALDIPQEYILELYELKKLSSSINERIDNLEKKIKLTKEGGEIKREKEKKVPLPAVEKAPKEKEQSIESKIGRVWFNRIGVLAVIFGIAYFLKYAFDNNWIGELGRVILGLSAGIVMIAIGEGANRRKYKVFSEGLIAGGAAVLYLSIYAAFNFYHLIGATPAFIFMAMVTLYAAVFAIRFDSSRVISFSIIGGFLTPFFLSTGKIGPHLFMAYILLLDIGILCVSYFKKWEYCNLLALIFTFIAYSSWYTARYQHEYFFISEAFLTTVFILFTLVAILYNFIHKQQTTQRDIAIVSCNGIFYFLTNYWLLGKEKISFQTLGFLSIGLAIIYLIFSYSAFARTRGKDRNLILTYLGLTILFATLAIPLEMKYHWVTIGFILESTILIWLGFNINFKELRVSGLILGIFALLKLLLYDFYETEIYVLIFNERFVTYFVCVAGALVSAYLYRENRKNITEGERPLATFLAISAAIILFISLTQEVNSYFQHLKVVMSEPGVHPSWLKSSLRHIRQFSISALWAVYSFISIMIGIVRKFRALRLMALIIFMITTLKVFIIDIFAIGQIWRILSLIGLGIVLIVTSFLYQRYKNKFVEFVESN